VAKKKKHEEPRERVEVPNLVFSIIAFLGAVFFAIAPFRLAGRAGDFSYRLLEGFLGNGYILFPITLLAVGILYGTSWKKAVPLTSTIGGAVAFVSLFGLLEIAFSGSAGLFGVGIALPFTYLFDSFGGAIILLALFLIGGIFFFRLNPEWKPPEKLAMPTLSFLKKKDDVSEEPTYGTMPIEDAPEVEKEVAEEKPKVTPPPKTEDDEDAMAIRAFGSEYHAPPLSLLEKDRGKPGVGDVKANANIIKRTFQNFGISVEMDEVTIGPTVTRYAFKPAEGVRLQKIVGLQNNLELALAAHPVRIEAPIPGKSLVGIEVPNTAKAMVGLGGLIGSPESKKSDAVLFAALGRDITGLPHFANIGKMPHGLIAGATGSGKSVAIHAIITSLLYRNGPDLMRLIMVDPKRVELTLYNGIPHLLTPVITEPKKAILALKWAAKEMERRYDIFEKEKVRDISSYHAKMHGNDNLLPMPYIVVVVDELADIMQAYPRELEAGIVRLAQMSRAVGIHLILSTQRPSVNVITGLIKANVPTRLALQVASQIDSRTILDAPGAEKLLGAGDMLFLSGDRGKPVRLQTAFISEDEVKNVVSYIKKHNSGDLSSIDFSGGSSNGEDGDSAIDAIMNSTLDEDVDDDLYEEAKKAVLEAGKASTSYLQRKLRIGYSRAARLIDLLEEKGVIGSQDGSKPREVIGSTRKADTDHDEPVE
jgi:S-DNA-T family DNA segregation ATPase FtsK/SpoIIIE